MIPMPGPPPPKPALAWVGRSLLPAAAALLLTCSPGTEPPGAAQPKERAVPHEPASRILFLHHSTGEAIWKAGLPQYLQAWNASHGTRYAITEMTYPMSNGGHTWLDRMLPTRVFRRLVHDRYPWDNYPYDYWNLWVAHTGWAPPPASAPPAAGPPRRWRRPGGRRPAPGGSWRGRGHRGP